MYTNDTALMVEFVVEDRGLIPSLHSELVAVGNTGHRASGGCTVYAAREGAKVTGWVGSLLVCKDPDLRAAVDNVPVIR